MIRLLEFLPLLAKQIKPSMHSALVEALQDDVMIELDNHCYFIAYINALGHSHCLVTSFESDLIKAAKTYRISQFFMLERVDSKLSITEL